MRSVTAVLVLALSLVVVVLAARAWAALLQDLGRTRDEELQVLTRKGWTLAIVAMFPVGAILYVMYGKDPDRLA